MQPLEPPLATPHSGHDLLLLAAAADRDSDPALAAAADAQAARCAECAELAAELRAMTTGLAALPRSRPVPRDMRLSPEQAARLARGGLWRRVLRPFGDGGLPALRPLAAALTTLGLAGLLLTASPFGFGAGGASPASRDMSAPAALPGAATAGPALGPAGGSPANEQGSTAHLASPPPKAASIAPPSAAPAGSTGAGAYPGPASSPSGTFDQGLSPAAPASGLSLPPLGWLSVGLLGAGLVLFSLVIVARRAG